MQAPFIVAAALSEDVAQILGIPSLTGAVGAMVLYDDGATRFVPAPAGSLIVSGSGRIEDDELNNRVEICRQWLERAERCQVELRIYAPATDDALGRWQAAEDEQAAALAAVIARDTPKARKRLAKAADARHKAFIELPPFPHQAQVGASA